MAVERRHEGLTGRADLIHVVPDTYDIIKYTELSTKAFN